MLFVFTMRVRVMEGRRAQKCSVQNLNNNLR